MLYNVYFSVIYFVVIICCRFYNASTEKDVRARDRDAKSKIRMYFAHIVNGVREGGDVMCLFHALDLFCYMTIVHSF